jgi:hypothetical protein
MRRSTLLALLALALLACPALAADDVSESARKLGEAILSWLLAAATAILTPILVAGAARLYRRLGLTLSVEEEEALRSHADEIVRALEEATAAKTFAGSKAVEAVSRLRARFPAAPDYIIKQTLDAAVQRIPAIGATGKIDGASPKA